ncbi:Ferredoxin--NADP reductase [Streptomyces violaceorubidus]
MRAQAERFGAELIQDDVVAVDLSGEIKTVTDTAGTVHRAKAVIVTTGSQHRKLGLPNEDALSGRGVSWCATCDGFFFKDQDIAVIGGGDTAMAGRLAGRSSEDCPLGLAAPRTPRAPGTADTGADPGTGAGGTGG